MASGEGVRQYANYKLLRVGVSIGLAAPGSDNRPLKRACSPVGRGECVDDSPAAPTNERLSKA